ncbi:DUF222 domain-containing protein, partial [Georgenia deserti]
GWLSPANGQLLDEALRARMGTPSANDPRTQTQRRANALTGLAHLALDSGTLKPGARIRPHLAVHVSHETLTHLIQATHPTATDATDQAGGPDGAQGPDETTGSGQPGRWTEPARSALVPASQETAYRPGQSPSHRPGHSPGQRPGHRPGKASGGVADGIIIPASVDNTVMTGTEPATLTDGTPISPRQLARLACQSQLHRVIFGPDSEILDSGREERLFTPGQTRAIIARDRHCVFPDCNAPPGEGEIHHSLWWYDQYGPTRIDLGLLVCWHHHDHIHAHDITITRRNDQWIFTRADGTEIKPTRPPT